jgi:hypothetical protein
MKIAICFSGQIRTGIYAAPNIKRYLGKLYDQCDIFIHTWNFNKEKNSQIIPLTNEEILEIKNIWNPKVFYIEDYKTTIQKFKKEYGIVTFDFTDSLYYSNGVSPTFMPLFYSWYRSITFKRDYELLNNFKYDLVIKMRPDVIYPKRRSLRKEIDIWEYDINAFYCDVQSIGNRVDDVFWLSSSEIMDRASCFWIKKLENEDINYTQKSYMEDIGIKIKYFGRHYLSGYAPLRYQSITKDVLTEWGKIFIDDLKLSQGEHFYKNEKFESFDSWLSAKKHWFNTC